MQSPLIQDGGDAKGGSPGSSRSTSARARAPLRVSARQRDEDDGQRLLAINDHEFLVDERDSKGRADAPGFQAGFKKLFRIDLQFAHDVSGTTS